MKYLILVGDGMGDLPIAELNGQTPLEYGSTPWLDELCANGELFLTKTVPDGFPPGSDVANLSLLGYPPEKYYTGRAPLEAAAMGINIAPDQTAFRCNLVTLKHEDKNVTMVDYSAGHIDSDDARVLIDTLNKECKNELFEFYPGVSYRHIMLVRGPYPQLDTVPPHDYIEQDVTAYWRRYMDDPNWGSLLEKAGNALQDHPLNRERIKAGKNPANGIWLWGEGKLPPTPSLKERFGISGSLISAVDLLKGLGVNSGLRIINVPGATGYLDTNYAGKAQAAIDALQSEDFVFVHVEAPDECGHQGSFRDKIQAIEDFDARIVGPIVEGLRKKGEDFRIIATMDHYTPVSLRTHIDDPVPTILYDSRLNQKGCGLKFNERHGKQQGDNGRFIDSGEKLLEKLTERQVRS